MTTREITEMRKSMLEAKVYSISDIDEICRLETEYNKLCKEIAEECEEEGYPSHGSNYDARCESLRQYYDEEISYIDAKYDTSEDDILE